LDAEINLGIERLLVQEFAEEAALDSVVGQWPISSLACPLDEFKECVLLVMGDGIALGIDDVALHLTPFAPEEAHQLLLGKRVIILSKPTHGLIAFDSIDVERATQMAHDSSVKRDLTELSSSVGIGLKQHIHVGL